MKASSAEEVVLSEERDVLLKKEEQLVVKKEDNVIKQIRVIIEKCVCCDFERLILVKKICIVTPWPFCKYMIVLSCLCA
ncbi:MAG: hypothetical protein R3Y58_08515 [Eubacteriales bacterium]